MNEFIANIEPYANALGWTLVHFIWQGALIFIAYWCITRFFLKNKNSSHYWVGMFFMLLCLIVPISEFLSQIATIQNNNVIASEFGIQFFTNNSQSILSTSELILAMIQKSLPYFVCAWFISVLFISNSLLKSWLKLKKLSKEKSLELSNELEQKFQNAIEQLKLRIKPLLVISEKIDVPATFGYFKPVLLIPASMLTKLPKEQMEAVLLHELCHIKRSDFLHNIVQILVETLFFYNPFTKWISKDLRKVREKCCDEMVLNFGTKPITYAKALTNIALLQNSINPTSLQIAANDGELLDRIKCLILKNQNKSPSSNISTIAVFGLLLGMMIYNFINSKDDPVFFDSSLLNIETKAEEINSVKYSIIDSFSGLKSIDLESPKEKKVLTSPIPKEFTETREKVIIPTQAFFQEQNNTPIQIDTISTNTITQNIEPIAATITNEDIRNPKTRDEQQPSQEFVLNYPKLTKMVNPKYSHLARKQGIEGTVILSFNISPNGRVRDISVDKSSHLKLLDGSARRALKQWRFEQESINQNILNNRYQQIFSFNLTGGQECINGDTGSRLSKGKLCETYE